VILETTSEGRSREIVADKLKISTSGRNVMSPCLLYLSIISMFPLNYIVKLSH